MKVAITGGFRPPPIHIHATSPDVDHHPAFRVTADIPAATSSPANDDDDQNDGRNGWKRGMGQQVVVPRGYRARQGEWRGRGQPRGMSLPPAVLDSDEGVGWHLCASYLFLPPYCLPGGVFSHMSFTMIGAGTRMEGRWRICRTTRRCASHTPPHFLIFFIQDEQ